MNASNSAESNNEECGSSGILLSDDDLQESVISFVTNAQSL